MWNLFNGEVSVTYKADDPCANRTDYPTSTTLRTLWLHPLMYIHTQGLPFILTIMTEAIT